MSENRLLAKLIGEQLSSVIFVQDYLQLDFDGKRLTLNAWPAVVVAGERKVLGQPMYRDTLCGLIGGIVTSVTDTDEQISLAFKEARIDVDLQADSDIEQVIYEDEASWGFW